MADTKVSLTKRDVKNCRNICILAHVDHGKTTLADNLLASNGIISSRMSGKLRYMDDRKDEQERGITMKASAVTLIHKMEDTPYTVNLIDSPGHVDFSTEVSSAVRLSDGAVVVVDVVEGVSAQTHTVLRQAWLEGVKPCLVLNKIDRLIAELQLSPGEAFLHLRRILEQVNAITGSLFTAEMMARREAREEMLEKMKKENLDQMLDIDSEERSDEELYFEPERGNVVFASAIDGWGFSVSHFARMVAKKLECRIQPLNKCIWGDYYLTKEKGQLRIKPGAVAKQKPTMFEKFVLQPIWDVYNGILSKDKDKTEKIIEMLGVKILPRDRQRGDAKTLVSVVMSQWIPLANALLDMVCSVLPSPADLPRERIAKLMYGINDRLSFPKETVALEDNIVACKSGTSDDKVEVVAFVPKLVSVEKSRLPDQKPKAAPSEEGQKEKREAILARRKAEGKDAAPTKEEDEDDDRKAARKAKQQQQKQQHQQHQQEEESGIHRAPSSASSTADVDGVPLEVDAEGNFIAPPPQTKKAEQAEAAAQVESEEKKDSHVMVAYTRVYSGTLRVGQKIHVLQAKYDPSVPDKFTSEATIQQLYLLMGRDFIPITEAPAGSIVGVTGLEGHVLKCVTLSSTLACPSFAALHIPAAPIVRVAIEAENIIDMPKLMEGMRKLNQADPCVEVYIQDSGETVLVGAGEVHIERCLTDLREQFCPGINIRVSPPIIPFRETIVEPPKVDQVNEEINHENTLLRKDNFWIKYDDVAFDDKKNVCVVTKNKHWRVHVSAKPLPPAVTRLLEERIDVLKALSTIANHAREESERLYRLSKLQNEASPEPLSAEAGSSIAPSPLPGSKDEVFHEQTEESKKRIAELYKALNAAFEEAGKEWKGVIDKIWSFGPRHVGPNILVNDVEGLEIPGVFDQVQAVEDMLQDSDKASASRELRVFGNSLGVGFQLITQTGPLCEEQMMGVAFFLSQVEVLEEGSAGDPGFSGQVITCMREACKTAFLVQPVRLMTATFACDLYVSSQSLGKVYAVLARRNSKILSEEMKEGTDNFLIKALIPVTDSFGFAEELRKRTSGLATPQLIFSHWDVIQDDPFWVPSTEEELLHFGEKGDRANIARKFVDDVRKRKGLPVEELIVQHAEKQRTLAKKK